MYSVWMRVLILMCVLLFANCALRHRCLHLCISELCSCLQRLLQTCLQCLLQNCAQVILQETLQTCAQFLSAMSLAELKELCTRLQCLLQNFKARRILLSCLLFFFFALLQETCAQYRHVHNSKQNVFCVDACTHTDVCTALCEQYTSPPLFTLVYI